MLPQARSTLLRSAAPCCVHNLRLPAVSQGPLIQILSLSNQSCAKYLKRHPLQGCSLLRSQPWGCPLGHVIASVSGLPLITGYWTCLFSWDSVALLLAMRGQRHGRLPVSFCLHHYFIYAISLCIVTSFDCALRQKPLQYHRCCTFYAHQGNSY